MSAETGTRTAYDVAAEVVDPELPPLTLADLGVLRGVEERPGGGVVVTITPTYSGCPALATMRDDLVHRLQVAGHGPVEVRVELSPAWSTDDITAHGRTLLAQQGVAPPGPAPARGGPVPLSLGATRHQVDCPRCGSGDTSVVSEFGPTACTSLLRCERCGEPFQHLREH